MVVGTGPRACPDEGQPRGVVPTEPTLSRCIYRNPVTLPLSFCSVRIIVFRGHPAMLLFSSVLDSAIPPRGRPCPRGCPFSRWIRSGQARGPVPTSNSRLRAGFRSLFLADVFSGCAGRIYAAPTFSLAGIDDMWAYTPVANTHVRPYETR